jgi:hypothetical protein
MLGKVGDLGDKGWREKTYTDIMTFLEVKNHKI